MQLLHILKLLGQSMLESDAGSSNEAFSHYIKLLIFFEYNYIAKLIIANTKRIDNKMICEYGTITQIFDKCS